MIFSSCFSQITLFGHLTLNPTDFLIFYVQNTQKYIHLVKEVNCVCKCLNFVFPIPVFSSLFLIVMSFHQWKAATTTGHYRML